MLENPNFCNHIYFILEYVIFCKICSAKWSARDERKSLGEKKQCKVKQEPDKEKKMLESWDVSILSSERESAN